MNPGFYVNDSSYQNAETRIHLVMTMGTSGAVPALGAGGVDYGVVSCTLSGTSTYTIVFGGQWFGLLNYIMNNHQATYNASTGACFVQLISSTASTQTIVVETVNAAGTATAPASGDIMHLTFIFQIAGN
jgi:hypothetical protein